MKNGCLNKNCLPILSRYRHHPSRMHFFDLSRNQAANFTTWYAVLNEDSPYQMLRVPCDSHCFELPLKRCTSFSFFKSSCLSKNIHKKHLLYIFQQFPIIHHSTSNPHLFHILTFLLFCRLNPVLCLFFLEGPNSRTKRKLTPEPHRSEIKKNVKRRERSKRSSCSTKANHEGSGRDIRFNLRNNGTIEKYWVRERNIF